jgi:hypothetical protein
LEKR